MEATIIEIKDFNNVIIKPMDGGEVIGIIQSTDQIYIPISEIPNLIQALTKSLNK